MKGTINSQGQTVIEFILLVGIVTMALYFMGPMIKRGLQSIIKVTADQIGNQANSDQEVDIPVNQTTDPNIPINSVQDSYSGYLVASNSTMASRNTDIRTQRIYVTNSIFDEQMNMSSNSITDMGFTQEQQ